ncbi:hypothetical protein HD554DRAFT_2206892 [Boletus coccyginus]|nr:hypothetical protein HD554DRAFT_2206892 [Boletus coccyginus]
MPAALYANVTGGFPIWGLYKISTLTTATNHQPVLLPIAQHGVPAGSLSLYPTLTIKFGPPSTDLVKITYSGEGADEVPLDPYRNLTPRVALYVLRCNNHHSFPPELVNIHADNQTPFGRGPGSSGAAVIAGVLLGNALEQFSLSCDGILDYALMVERHLTRAVAIIPRFELKVLPTECSRKDLLIYEAMKDHQPYRKILIPGLPGVTSSFTPQSHRGLFGICLSGAGPTILALAAHNFEVIAEGARAIFERENIQVDRKLLEVAGGSQLPSGASRT